MKKVPLTEAFVNSHLPANLQSDFNGDGKTTGDNVILENQLPFPGGGIDANGDGKIDNAQVGYWEDDPNSLSFTQSDNAGLPPPGQP